eukprot:SAG31_NODE_18615_length_629_cov_1.166038_1_plen_39_part_10
MLCDLASCFYNITSHLKFTPCISNHQRVVPIQPCVCVRA